MSDLNFHSFQNDFSVNSTNAGFSGNIGDSRDGDKNVLVADDVSTTGSSKNFFSISYYQQFFDVDTEQVIKRTINSVVPTSNNFILDFIQPLPDLWGPFWISTTLVFCIGVFANIAQYIENSGDAGNYGSDFRMVTSSSTLIFCYVVFVPLALFAVLWHRKSDLQYPYLDILCAYGYSLSIFIPVSLLWIIDINWFRWCLIFGAVALSGSVLAKAIYPAFKNDSNRLVAFGAVFSVLALHFLLAFAFKELYFDAVHPPKSAKAVLTEDRGNISQAASQVLQTSNATELPLPHAAIGNLTAQKESDPNAAGTKTVEEKKEEDKKAVPAAKAEEAKSSEHIKKDEDNVAPAKTKQDSDSANVDKDKKEEPKTE